MANNKTDKLKDKLALGVEPSQDEMSEAEKEQKQRNSSVNSITKQRDSWVAMISAFIRHLREKTDNLTSKKSTVQSDEPKTKTSQFKVPQPVFNALDLLREKALSLVGKFKTLFAKLTENLATYTQLAKLQKVVKQKQTSVVQQVVNVINNALQQNLLPQLAPQQAQQMQNALNMALQYGQPNNPNNNQAAQYLQENPNIRYLIVERIRCDHEAYNVKTSDGSKIDDHELGKILGQMPHLRQGVMFVKQLYEMRPELKDSDENEHMVNTGFDLFKDNNLGKQYGTLQSEYNEYTDQMNVYENEIHQEYKELKELSNEMRDLPPGFIHPDYQREMELADMEEDMRRQGFLPEGYDTPSPYK